MFIECSIDPPDFVEPFRTVNNRAPNETHFDQEQRTTYLVLQLRDMRLLPMLALLRCGG